MVVVDVLSLNLPTGREKVSLFFCCLVLLSVFFKFYFSSMALIVRHLFFFIPDVESVSQRAGESLSQ